MTEEVVLDYGNRIAEQQTAELRKRNNALLKTQKDMVSLAVIVFLAFT